MPAASQKSLQDEKGRYLQRADAEGVRKFGAAKGADVFSARAAASEHANRAATDAGRKLVVVDAPQEAIDRGAKDKAKAPAKSSKKS